MQGEAHLCDMKCFARNKVHVCSSEEHLYYKEDQIQVENIWKSNKRRNRRDSFHFAESLVRTSDCTEIKKFLF